MACSMSRKGDWWHTRGQSVNSLKNEWEHGMRYATWNGAMVDICEYIEVFGNRKQQHSTLGYFSLVS